MTLSSEGAVLAAFTCGTILLKRCALVAVCLRFWLCLHVSVDDARRVQGEEERDKNENTKKRGKDVESVWNALGQFSVVTEMCCATCLGRESKKDDLCDVQYKRKCDGKSDTIERPYLDVVDILPSSKSSKTCVCD